MDILNIEIKARSNRLSEIRKILKDHNAEYKGLDHQIDTYFNVPNGRLKLRQGNIENSLIFYDRVEVKGLKKSDIALHRFGEDPKDLIAVLAKAYGIWKEVNKQREIYFLGNVKIHLDQLKGLGDFVEIEAISHGEFSEAELRDQCQKYIKLFAIQENDLIDQSYSDMI